MDLTPIFSQAISHSNGFDLNKWHLEIRNFAESQGYHIDWDSEDGENWGRILNHDDVICIFHAIIPLIFINRAEFHLMTNYLSHQQFRKVSTFNVSDWKEQIFTLDVKKLIPIVQWQTILNDDQLISINDLWYATN